MKKTEDIYQKAFDDFEPLNTTDGSYLGIKNAVKRQEEHMRDKL